jgi:hypothetical protein
MKSIEKFLSLVLVVIITTQSNAQTFSVKGGYNLATWSMKDLRGDESVLKWQPGFQIGGLVDFPVAEKISFETGLLFSTKGTRILENVESNTVSYNYDFKATAMYLEIPLNAKTTFDVRSIKIYTTLGPYLGYGLGGKNKTERTVNQETIKENVDLIWGKDNGELKRFDAGLAIGAGVEFNSLIVGINYGYGLANILSNSVDGPKVRNRVLGISAGYKFVKK